MTASYLYAIKPMGWTLRYFPIFVCVSPMYAPKLYELLGHFPWGSVSLRCQMSTGGFKLETDFGHLICLIQLFSKHAFTTFDVCMCVTSFILINDETADLKLGETWIQRIFIHVLHETIPRVDNIRLTQMTPSHRLMNMKELRPLWVLLHLHTALVALELSSTYLAPTVPLPSDPRLLIFVSSLNTTHDHISVVWFKRPI